MSKKEKQPLQSASSGLRRTMPIILLALAVFIGICYITKDDTGMLGYAISRVFLGLFSVGAYAIPPLLAIHALFFSSDIKEKRLTSRIIFSVLTVISISVFAHSVATWSIAAGELPFDPMSFYTDGTATVGGGLVGGVIGFALMSFLGHIGVIILSVAVFAIYVAFFFAKGSALREVGRIIIYGVLTFFAIIEKGIKKLISPFNKEKGKVSKRDLESTRMLANDDFFDVDNGIARLEVSGLGIVESRSRASIEASPTLHEKVYHTADSRVIYENLTERDAGDNDIIVDEHENVAADDVIDYEPTVADEPIFESAPAFAPDSADGIFTADFDPYDLAISEKLAAKPSSYSASADTRPRVTELIDDVSPEQYERMKRAAEFEERKRRVIEDQRRSALERREADESAKKVVEFRVGDGEILAKKVVEDGVSVTIEKFDQPEVHTAQKPTDDNVYSTIYAPIRSSASIGRVAEPVAPQFKPFEVADEKPGNDGGFVFEFGESESISVERTLLTEERARGAEPVAATENVYRPTFEHVASSAPESTVIFDISDDPEATAEKVTTFTVSDEPREFSLFEDSADDDDEDIECAAPDDEDDFGDDEEIPPEKQNPFISEARGMFDMFRREAEPAEEPSAVKEEFSAEPDESEADEGDIAIESAPIVEEEDEDDEPPFEFLGNDGAVRRIEQVKIAEPKPAPKKKKPDFRNYKFPSIDLLGLDPIKNEDEIGVEIKENTRILVETLASFNVTASIKGVDRGPRVTRYEVVPARGVKVNQVTHLFDDIRPALAAEGVRMEAPIPGRSAIGFEIPNKHPKNVRLRELLECDEFQNSASTTYVCLGKDVAGNPVFGDIAKFPHALVAGATGMGKSVCINSILISMLYKARPDEVRFILIDPKKVEFKIYSGIPHLLVPVVTEAKQAAGALMWAVEEMERRYDLIEQHNVRNLQAYNEKVAKDPSIGEPLSKIVIVIDELNDLMMQVRDPAEDLIMRIAQKARAAGIHLIIGTQRPDVKVITGTIKANIGTRISCKVTSVVDSRTILEMAGAEKLLNKGDMLYKPTDRTEPVRVQGCFVSDDEVEAVMEHLKQFSTGEQYDEEVLAEINKAAQKCGKEKRGQDSEDGSGEECGYYGDQQFLDAVEVAIRSGKVSTSLLQRKLQIGFGKAARFIDGMEEIGIVSEPNGQKPRDVLVTMDEWREKLSRVDFG